MSHTLDVSNETESSAETTRATAGRVTVALIPKAAGDLARLQAATGLSKTDAINRAISLYEFIDARMRDGAEVLLRRDGETQRVHLL